MVIYGILFGGMHPIINVCACVYVCACVCTVCVYVCELSQSSTAVQCVVYKRSLAVWKEKQVSYLIC